MSTTDFFFLALAVWRVVNLICNETGPFAMFEHIRGWTKHHEETRPSSLLAKFHVHELNTCEWCLSMWVGAFTTVTYWKFPVPTMWIAYALSLSTCTIVLKYVVHLIQNAESLLDTQKKIIIRAEYNKRKEVQP